ncbi:unnamed protein product, partial [Allacma fusca]
FIPLYFAAKKIYIYQKHHSQRDREDWRSFYPMTFDLPHMRSFVNEPYRAGTPQAHLSSLEEAPNS